MPIGYTEQPSGLLDRFYRGLALWLSKFSGGADALPPPEKMEGFRRAQGLANETVTHVAEQLRPGMTEIEVAQLLESYLKFRGSERYLHRPFAWFGNHARFDEYESYDDYHPSDRKLEASDTVILDVSPILDGYIGDVGYTVSLAPNPKLDKAKAFLLQLRAAIPEMFMSEMTPREIWHEVDRQVVDAGYDNIHSKYPFCTLGHRVFRVKPRSGKEMRFRVGKLFFGWFSMATNLAFLRMGPSATINAQNVGKKLGLWAIEPHIGWTGGGAKFEEILVVEPDRCYWLEEDVPHVREARQRRAENG